MRKLVIFALVFFVAITANPIKVDDNKSEAELKTIIADGNDRKIFEKLIPYLNRRGIIIEGDDVQSDQMTLVKKILKQRISLPEAIETLSAVQDESSSARKVDLKKKFRERIAQLKDKLPENMENSIRFEQNGSRKKLLPSPNLKNFKVPENIKLPEKFNRKLKVDEKLETEEARNKTSRTSSEKLKQKLSKRIKMMKKMENFKDAKSL
jgi:predicted RND superfamily exporter protein